MPDGPARSADLTARSGVHGRIVDGHGAAVAGAVITLTDLEGGQIAHLEADPAGRYRFDVPGGRFLMAVVADPLPPQARTLTVGPGALHRDVELGAVARTVDPGNGRLGGVVRSDRSGAPVADAYVALTRPGGRTVASAVTGPDGEFAFEGLTTGTYTLTTAGQRSTTTFVQVGTGDLDVTVGREPQVGSPHR